MTRTKFVAGSTSWDRLKKEHKFRSFEEHHIVCLMVSHFDGRAGVARVGIAAYRSVTVM